MANKGQHLLTVSCFVVLCHLGQGQRLDRPSFSWETVPIFMHAMNESGPLNNTAARFMATFPIVTIEKNQDGASSPCCNEDKTITAAQQIKAHSTATRVLLYQNTIINFPFNHLSHAVPEDLLLHDDHGDLVYLAHCHKGAPNYTIFDLSQKEMRELWVANAEETITKSAGAIDGVFADRGRASAEVDLDCESLSPHRRRSWDQGHDLMMQDLMLRVSNVTDRGLVIPNGADIAGVNGRMFEVRGWPVGRQVTRCFQNMRANDTTSVPSGDDLTLVMRETRIVEAHADKCSHGSAAFNSSLAAFLISANEYHYYACTQGWTLQEGWDQLYPEYSEALGPPTGAATKSPTGVWMRFFRSGTQVRLDEAWAHPCIRWASGRLTGNDADCSLD